MEKDAQFFASVSIIDYSVLLGEVTDSETLLENIQNSKESEEGVYVSTTGKAYLIGIIDILTEFK